MLHYSTLHKCTILIQFSHNTEAHLDTLDRAQSYVFINKIRDDLDSAIDAAINHAINNGGDNKALQIDPEYKRYGYDIGLSCECKETLITACELIKKHVEESKELRC